MTALACGGISVTTKEAIAIRLRAKGVKPTTQRLEIGRLILGSPRHVSADQLLVELRKSGSRVSKATVYNTLNLFAANGLLREVSVDPVRQFYDSTIEPHHHFYNVDTGELTDIPMDQLAFDRLPDLPAGTEAQDVEVVVRVRNRA